MESLNNKHNQARAVTLPSARDLQFHLISAKNPREDQYSLYTASYHFWKQVWSETFYELENLDKLMSDEFLRQDEILFFTHQGKIAGLFAFSFFNLSFEAHLEHSYFETYTPHCFLEFQNRQIQQVMTMGFLTVAKEYRRTHSSLPISEILLGLATKRFLESKAQALIAYTRNDRKINDLVYRYGAISLEQGRKAHNVEVDLIAIYRDEVRESPVAHVPRIVEELWNRKKYLSQECQREKFNESARSL